jgi:hypothetical protein
MRRIPERQTPIERLVGLLPLRYSLASLAWAVIMGPLGYRVAESIQYGSLQAPRLYDEFLGSLVIFYLFYIVRYLRLRVVTSEPLIAPVLAGGEEAYHSAFGKLGDSRFMIVLAAILEVPAFIATSSMMGFSTLGAYNLVTQLVVILALACLSGFTLSRVGGCIGLDSLS